MKTNGAPARAGASDGTLALLSGGSGFHAETGSSPGWLRGLPDASVDLVMFSPPYFGARKLKEGGALVPQPATPGLWVEWLVAVATQCRRVCRGLTVMVVEGWTKEYLYHPLPALLEAALFQRGFFLRKTCVYGRQGIFGSGGKDYWRNDWEPVIVFASERGRLPWAEPLACGRPPKYPAGGNPSHRNKDGGRVNGRPYTPPDISNPGNVVWVGASGGGHLGSKLAHENEAPYCEELAERFILSFCPPGGVVLDPMCGSGTTLAVAVAHGRKALGADLRPSQVDLTWRRVAEASAAVDGAGTKKKGRKKAAPV
jgi:DNA modification methylase